MEQLHRAASRRLGASRNSPPPRNGAERAEFIDEPAEVAPLCEDSIMSKPKNSKRRSKALPALGFAGVSFSMASGACASTSEALNTPPPSQGNELFLGEEELSDVSLATIYVFDKENTGAPPLAEQLRLARGGSCVGCVGYACGGSGGRGGI